MTESENIKEESQQNQDETVEKILSVMHENGYIIESTLVMNGLYTSYEESMEVVKAIRLCKIDDIAKRLEHISNYNPGSIDRKREEKEMWCRDFDEKHCDCFLPNITEENCYCAIEKMKKAAARSMRQSSQYRDWRKSVLKRDDHTCQHCESKKHLHAHHIKPYSKYPDGRFDIRNGVTLCSKCHKAEHKKYGNGMHE